MCRCEGRDQRVEQYTVGGHGEFAGSTLIQDAVIRNLQVLAESTQRLSETLKAQFPATEWKKISGFRNVLVHNYLGIDVERVWQIVCNDLPRLKSEIQTMLQSPGSQKPSSAGDAGEGS